MKKIVINSCYSGFGLSHEAIMLYAQKKGITIYAEKETKFENLIPYRYWLVPPEQRPEPLEDEAWHNADIETRKAYNQAYSAARFNDRDLERDDPTLIAVVEEMGQQANGRYAELRIVEIPDDVDWEIGEYDGREWVQEKHRTWS